MSEDLKMDITEEPKLTITEETVEINHFCTNKVLEKLREFRDKDLFCDAVIYAPVDKSKDIEHRKWGKLCIHSAIVACGSAHLQRTFLQGQNRKMYTFYVDHIDLKFVKMCVDYIYREPVVFIKDEMDALKNAAEVFALNELANVCIFSKSNIKETNFEISLESVMDNIESKYPYNESESNSVKFSTTINMIKESIKLGPNKENETNSVEHSPDRHTCVLDSVETNACPVSNFVQNISLIKEMKNETIQKGSETKDHKIDQEYTSNMSNLCTSNVSHSAKAENILEGTPSCISSAIQILSESPSYVAKETTEKSSKETDTPVKNTSNAVKEMQEFISNEMSKIVKERSQRTSKPVSEETPDYIMDIGIKKETDVTIAPKQCYVTIRNILNSPPCKSKDCIEADFSGLQPVSTTSQSVSSSFQPVLTSTQPVSTSLEPVLTRTRQFHSNSPQPGSSVTSNSKRSPCKEKDYREQNYSILKRLMKRKRSSSDDNASTQPVSTSTQLDITDIKPVSRGSESVSCSSESKYRLRRGKSRNYALMHSGNHLKRNVTNKLENCFSDLLKKKNQNNDSCSSSTSSSVSDIPKIIGSIIVLNDTESNVSEDTSSLISSETSVNNNDCTTSTDTVPVKKQVKVSGSSPSKKSCRTNLSATETSDTESESTNRKNQYNLRKGKSTKNYALAHHGRVSSNKHVIVSMSQPEQDNTICSSTETSIKNSNMFSKQLLKISNVCSLKHDNGCSSTFGENCTCSVAEAYTSSSTSSSLLRDALVNPTVFSDQSLLENWRKCNSQLSRKDLVKKR